MIRASLGVSPSPNGIAFFPKAFEVVVGQLHLGTVDAFALTTTLQQRRQVFVEHASLLNSGIAVIKDLRQGGLQPNTVAYVTLEQDQRIQAVLGRSNAAVFLLVLCQFERRLR